MRGMGHAFERTELGTGRFLGMVVLAQTIGHQDVFNGAQNGIEVPACGDGHRYGQNLPQNSFFGGIRLGGEMFLLQLSLIQKIADAHIAAGGEFRHCVADHDRHAGVAEAHDGETVDEQHHHADAHRLLQQLGPGGAAGLPAGDKVAPQTGGYPHRGQTEGENLQGRASPGHP